ncbi:hypothetical protein GFS24_02035 [Chitinophaga sp. SYP-B3965]|uniref:lipopolysaccharide biosynthesis protein n=1 Tax=Chitinophaga sp. SYP-B3965 TaxID=2663120 RepID=UPI00129951D5|nr:hypothetical protein [Chitinophaga sp. SYP-B3965]MRG43871.1 hypothetical protein [Chitinophaga sp. SYP-B3965]
MQAANRVVLNTGFLYGKMLISMFIALYATRLVLNALGVEDYGIFNLVSGIVAMLSFLNSSMTLSTQRYMSFFLGAGDEGKLKTAFNSSVWLHLVIGIVVVGLLEIAGIYLFNNVLNIPVERLPAAKIIFHFMTLSAFFVIISVPYDAIINTHENMFFVAILGILESVVRLSIAICLQYAAADKLILYCGVLVLLTVVLLIAKRVYCALHYKESKINIRDFDGKLLKEMFAYSGWGMVGASGVIAKTQGVAMILNVFFGTVINAAFGIANQVNAQLSFFAVTMLQSLNPQLVKSEGSGNRERMIMLSLMACKFSFYLMAFFAIPALIEMPFVLKLWLNTIPEHTVIFCRLIIIASLAYQLSAGLQMAVHAVGRIGTYQVIMSILLLLNLPGAYLLLKAGWPPASVLVLSIFLECVITAYRIFAAKRHTGMSVGVFLQRVVWSAMVPVGFSALAALIPYYFMEEGFARLLCTGMITVATLTLFIRLMGLTPYEKEKLEGIIFKVIAKLHPRLVIPKAN